MELHTQETLDKLSFRELQQVVKSLDLVAQGNREELSARILEAQVALPPAPEDVVPGDVVATGEPPVEVTTTEQVESPTPPVEVPVEVVEGPTVEVAPEVVEAPVKKVAPVKPQAVPARVVSSAAKRHAGQMISGYLSSENYGKDVEQSVVAALECGEQPCIVKGEGNTKFELKIFPKIFNKADLSSDVSRADGALVNVSRRLADANLLPYT